jgi:O-antigen/teichoic acid export membrane protein
MNSVKRVAKNSSITMVAKAIALLGSLFTLALVARYLTPESFGEYIFVMAFIAVFEVFTDMGYNATVVREIARARDQLSKIVGTAIVAKFFIGLLTFIGIVICVNALGAATHISPHIKKAIYILGFSVCADFFVDVTISAVRAHEEMEYEALILTFNSISSLAFIAIVAVMDLGFVNLFVARFCSYGLTLGLSVYIYARKFGLPKVFRDDVLREHLRRESLPLGTGQVIERFYTRTNFFLIRVIQSVTEVGFYGGAYRVIEQFSLVAVSIVTAVFPVFSVLSQSSHSSLALAHEKTLKFLVVVSLPVVVIMSCLAEQITGIVFGARHTGIAQPLKVLSFAVLLTFCNLLFKFTLSALNRQAVYRRNVLVAFFVNLLLALFLIHSFGYMGGCVALLASLGILCFLGHHSTSKYLAEVSLRAVFVKPVTASLAMMGLMVILIRHVGVLFVVPCGMFVYLIVLIALRTFTSDEIRALGKTMIPAQGQCHTEDIKHA